MHFAYTAPAVVPAEVAIEFGVTGAYGILIGGAPSTLRAVDQAARLLDEGRCDRGAEQESEQRLRGDGGHR